MIICKKTLFEIYFLCFFNNPFRRFLPDNTILSMSMLPCVKTIDQASNLFYLIFLKVEK